MKKQFSDLETVSIDNISMLAVSVLLALSLLTYLLCVGSGYPFFTFAYPLPIHFLIFCSFLLFPFTFCYLLYLSSSIVYPFPFYQNCPTPFSGPRL